MHSDHLDATTAAKLAERNALQTSKQVLDKLKKNNEAGLQEAEGALSLFWLHVEPRRTLQCQCWRLFANKVCGTVTVRGSSHMFSSYLAAGGGGTVRTETVVLTLSVCGCAHDRDPTCAVV